MVSAPFSVSMCVYAKDDPQHFDMSLASVINQTVPPSEIVLVADGPLTPELETVIGKYENTPGFVVLRLSENLGHGAARRTGLEACSNELVALMDADDISRNDRFEKQLEVFGSDTELSAVGGQISEFIGAPDNLVGERIVPLDDADIKLYMKKRCPMNQVTVMFKKSDVLTAGGYLDWYCNEDYYLWLRMAQRGMKFANTGDVLVDVRVGDEMYRRRGGLKYFSSEARLQKYMLDNKIIGLADYISNVAKRFILQVLLPGRLRGFIFRKLARD